MTTRVAIVAVTVWLVAVAWPVWASAQAAVPAPILKPPPKIVSLHRPHEDWKVVTTVTLAIEPTTEPAVKRIFRWTKPEHGEIKCESLAETARETEMPAGSSSIRCTYQPDVGFHDVDKFNYDVKFDGGPFTPQGTVTVEVRERGFRWEFKTNGSTISSDSPPDPNALAEIPSVIGGTSQDFLFTVNWQTMRPRRRLMDENLATTAGLLRQSQLQVEDNMASRIANVVVETGVQSEAVAATVKDVGASATTAAPAGTGTGTTTQEAVARRNLVLRGEFNYNAGLNVDGVGRFVEVGGLGRGSFTRVLDSDESFKEAVGRVLQIVPRDRDAFKVEGGFRVAIKQAHELDTTTIVRPGGQTERPTNVENALLVEVTWRYDSSLRGLATDSLDGNSSNRWAIRTEYSPEITVLPGHQLPSIGFEVSKAWAGGAPSVKVTYGVNLSATKGIFAK
jgi:hypothetical protein